MIRLNDIYKLILCGIVVTFGSCSDSDDSEPMEEPSVELTTALSGFYVGSIAADQGLADTSVIIRPNGTDRFNGEYFGTSNFTPCCNVEGNDGTLNFQVEGLQLLNMAVRLDSELPPCTANIDGNGEATLSEEGNRLVFNLIQDGCGVQNFPVTLTVVKVRNLE
ncbi:hypothetical protein MTsPCn5_07580 [Croceitalea sp. MTPC5]|uniref:hypothetical protein n=1 Tax=Croceitalea sp. MTPC5 TaxID=3056565 RepID=UPI002B3FAA88|nr:hypothetical protein MTsPCn5_07580 [Croceitalea sp. MTPC5]